jgi:hypothetical protein
MKKSERVQEGSYAIVEANLEKVRKLKIHKDNMILEKETNPNDTIKDLK